MASSAVPSLAVALATIPDCRAARGKRHGLPPIPPLVCVAARVLGQAAPPGLAGVALDGKTLRGGKRRGAADASLLAPALEGRAATADAARAGPDEPGPWRRLPAEGEGRPAAIARGHRGGLRRRGPAGRHHRHGGGGTPARRAGGDASAGHLDRRTRHQATGRVLRQETACAVTSSAPAAADPARLLARWRAHRGSEHRPHRVRDVTCDEDRARAHTGPIPQALAAWRNVAIGLLRLLGEANIAAATRRYAAQPARARAAVGLALDYE